MRPTRLHLFALVYSDNQVRVAVVAVADGEAIKQTRVCCWLAQLKMLMRIRSGDETRSISQVFQSPFDLNESSSVRNRTNPVYRIRTTTGSWKKSKKFKKGSERREKKKKIEEEKGKSIICLWRTAKLGFHEFSETTKNDKSAAINLKVDFFVR
ncbi:hypothetical protein KQX54_002428 [Cotesia glomerata]|uniref:Uncharacterized protein n=1 Tax=Cotesia glomerata TaxID=32391 RepID=A0AAV7I6A1_COTGL|nr:hypothetical protein KQX54_002428 [Cotesia glomerata]